MSNEVTLWNSSHGIVVRMEKCRDWGVVTPTELANFMREFRTLARMPKVVCLCGSTRFHDEFVQTNYELTCLGNVVLSVGFFANTEGVHGEGVGITPELKEKLDELHKRKIDLADEVVVVAPNGYVGESTRGEIAYAIRHNVPVTLNYEGVHYEEDGVHRPSHCQVCVSDV